MPFTPDDEMRAFVESAAPYRREDGTVNLLRMANDTGIARQTLQSRVKAAAARGFLGLKPVLPGFAIKSTSAQQDADGNVEKTWTKQAPAGEPFTMPAGHTVKGVSALLDASGNTIQQWIKTREDSPDILIDAIKSAFEAYRGKAEPVDPATNCEADLLTIYNIADHHLGMFAWGKETGVDYDVKIGEKLLLDSMSQLVANAPAASTAIVLNLGDFFHADNSLNRTPQSGNTLDVDTRYAQVLQVGVRLMIQCIELALGKHDRVIVRCLPGNHDIHTSLALSAALSAFFARNERVTVDCDPSKFFWHVFGKVFIGATHGDMVKPERMPGVMASMKPQEWGKTVHRYAYFGHVHHASKGGGERDGVVWETFQTLSPKDAWHHQSGYVSGRSMVAITHHKQRGEVLRHTVSVK